MSMSSVYAGHVVHVFILPKIAMRPMDITWEEVGGSSCGQNPLDVTM